MKVHIFNYRICTIFRWGSLPLSLQCFKGDNQTGSTSTHWRNQSQGSLSTQLTSPQSKPALNPGSHVLHGHAFSTALITAASKCFTTTKEFNFTILLRSEERVSALQQAPTAHSHKWPEEMLVFQNPILTFEERNKRKFNFALVLGSSLQVSKKLLHGEWSRFRDPVLEQHRDHTV